MRFKPSHSRRQRLNINNGIPAREVRVVMENGDMVGVLPLDEALKRAHEEGLDLVEISPQADPPVCKIIDFGKYNYQQEKKKKEAKKHQKIIHLKEIKMRPKTDVHDYNFKVKHVREFLGNGDRVKITIKFRGREMVHTDGGKIQLDKVMQDTSDIGKVEIPPRLEGRNMHMTLVPIKK